MEESCKYYGSLIRKFRWLLDAGELSKFSWTNVRFDFLNKKITARYIELPENKIDICNYQKRNGIFHFKTLDQNGNILYERKFTNVNMTKCFQEFDYSSSEIATINVEFEYGDMILQKISHTYSKGESNEKDVSIADCNGGNDLCRM